MKLKERINKDYMTAMKEKNSLIKNLLSVVKGEIQNVEIDKGDITDDDVIKVLLKTSKSLKEMVSNGSKEAMLELEAIESYLPKQMSKEEITQKVTELINSGVTQMGLIMKEFSNLPADKKSVSEIFRSLTK
jgi:uncharacterized protein YqeY